MTCGDRPTIALPGNRVAEIEDIDPNRRGKSVSRARVIDTVGLLERAGTIEPEHRMAADAFRADFHRAHLSGIRLCALHRIDISAGPRGSPAGELAARRVFEDLKSLGGVGSIASNALWRIVGMESSIRAWATERGMEDKRATGVLISALDIVAWRRGIFT